MRGLAGEAPAAVKSAATLGHQATWEASRPTVRLHHDDSVKDHDLATSEWRGVSIIPGSRSWH